MPDPDDIKRAAEGLQKAASNETIWAAWSAFAAAVAAILWRVLRHAGPLLRLARGDRETAPQPVDETAAGLVQVLTRLADTITQQACSQADLNIHLRRTEELLQGILDQCKVTNGHMISVSHALKKVGMDQRNHADQASTAHKHQAELLSHAVSYVGQIRERLARLAQDGQPESD